MDNGHDRFVNAKETPNTLLLAAADDTEEEFGHVMTCQSSCRGTESNGTSQLRRSSTDRVIALPDSCILFVGNI